MPMPLNQPQQSLPNATNAALSAAQQPQAQTPQQPQQVQGPQKPPKANDAGKFNDEGGNSDILHELEQHLNSLPQQQKTFIVGALQHYPNIVIPFVGIVCGQEVFQYFVNIYKHNFQQQGSQPGQAPQQQGQLPQDAPHPATGQPQNSAPAPQAGPNTGQPQQAPAQPQPQ